MNGTRVRRLFCEYLESKGYSPYTVKRYNQETGVFFKWLQTDQGKTDVRDVTSSDVMIFNQFLCIVTDQKGKKRYRESTIAGILKTISAMFKFLVVAEYILTNPFRRYEVKNYEQRRIRKSIPERTVEQFLESIGDESIYSKRDLALYELLYGTGIRAGEAIKLDVKDIDTSTGRIFIREGKGRKDRIVPMGKNLSKVLRGYLEDTRPKYIAGIRKVRSCEALFLTGRGNRLDVSSINKRLKRYFDNVEDGFGKEVCTHMLRHSFATHILEHGASIRQVQEMLGHSSMETTATYTHFSVKSLRMIMKRFHPRENELWEEV